MENTTKTFTYTAQRGSYISTVCALLFIMIVEGGVIAYLLVRFVPNELVKLALLFGLAVLFLTIGSKLLAPLWTKHQLSLANLQLHYGLDFKMDVPLEAIIAARQVRERVAFPIVRYGADRERVVAVFSEKGQVLLELNQTHPYRAGLFGRKLAKQLLINVDQRDEFLTALSTQVPFNGGQRAVANPILTSIAHTDSKGDRRSVKVTLSGAGTLAIRTENLTRHYKDFTAVDHLNLSVYAGEIYGFLGSNGAGKTTTMKMLVGLLRPDAGQAWIDGHDVWAEALKAKANFGYVADQSMLYDRLTGREFLDFLAQIRGIQEQEARERIEQLLEVLELIDRADTACGTYSFGMKRKLAIASALIHKPRVLIMDEPLNGLDPLSAHRLKDLFAELADDGTAIFLSTHDLATAESLCHRVGIIHKGRLLVEGSSTELRQIADAPGLEEAFLSLTAENEQVPV